MKIFLPLLLSVLIFAGCQKPQGFEYRTFKNFKVDSLGFNQSTVSMDLVFYNPNNFGVDLKNINCDVYVEHNYLGRYLLDTTMHIAKKAEFIIPSKMEVDMKNLFKNTLTSLFRTDLLLEVKGSTRVGKSGIFINYPFSYSGRHPFNVFK